MAVPFRLWYRERVRLNYIFQDHRNTMQPHLHSTDMTLPHLLLTSIAWGRAEWRHSRVIRFAQAHGLHDVPYSRRMAEATNP